MISVALDWIDWPAVIVLIAVSATWAEAWRRERRDVREERQWRKRVEALERDFRDAITRIRKLEITTGRGSDGG